MGKGSTAVHVHEPTLHPHMAGRRPWESDRVSFSIGAAGRTDRGHRRSENQDCILCDVSTDGTMGIFAVADGMGGQRAGEVASAITVATLREHLLPLLHEDQTPAVARAAAAPTGASPSGTQSLSETVNAAINRCNERILLHAAAHPETRGLGSTLTLVLIKGSLAVIGNIGDSRTYRVRGEAIERLTHDHSLVAHLAAIGQIAPDDVYSHPHRSYIYRALGTESEAQPDIMTERLQSGDTLLLCSDGLWEMVRDGDIHQAITGAPSPDEVAARLVAMANGNGGEDNISAIVVKVS